MWPFKQKAPTVVRVYMLTDPKLVTAYAIGHRMLRSCEREWKYTRELAIAESYLNNSSDHVVALTKLYELPDGRLCKDKPIVALPVADTFKQP